MGTEPTHYEVLGVNRGATVVEIRRAYRDLARRHHPDVSSRSSDDDSKMSRINEAWSVLSDKRLRTEYDARLTVGVGQPFDRSASRSDAGSSATLRPPTSNPARFPWRGMVAVAVIGSVLVLVAHAFTKPAAPGVPDQLISAGSCVDIDAQQMAVEVSCSGPYQAIVSQLIATDRTCPTGTEAHPDRQGMGVACVVRTTAGAGVQQQLPSG